MCRAIHRERNLASLLLENWWKNIPDVLMYHSLGANIGNLKDPFWLHCAPAQYLHAHRPLDAHRGLGLHLHFGRGQTIGVDRVRSVVTGRVPQLSKQPVR